MSFEEKYKSLEEPTLTKIPWWFTYEYEHCKNVPKNEDLKNRVFISLGCAVCGFSGTSGTHL